MPLQADEIQNCQGLFFMAEINHGHRMPIKNTDPLYALDTDN